MDSFDKFVGQTLDGRYNIEKVVGIGGMAVVFRATDSVTHRTVAIKMLKEDVAKDEASVKRFINESKAVAMLSHPNIVSIYDVSVSGEFKYIVMEYIEGITLKSYMSKRGALPLPETLSYCEQLLRALIHAHSRGIVHRDIKPQNIMLLKNGVIKVADFGIAKLPNADTISMTDRAMGTVYYISPEQASGMPIDARSDIYSTGVLLYEMATGKLPFNAESPVSVALMQVQDKPTPPSSLNPQIPKGLEQVILTAMEKSPKNRFQTAEQMARWIEALKRDPNTVFRSLPSPIEKKQKKEEPEPEPEKKRFSDKNYLGASMLPIILGVAFAFLIACIISAYYLWTEVLFNSDNEKSYIMTVDNFVGSEFSDTLEAELKEKNYLVHVEYVYDSSLPFGTIVEQEPLGGERCRVEPGRLYCDIYLTVSRGSETFTLPDVLMQDYRQIENRLAREYGLITEVIEDYNAAVTAGYIYRTEPATGSTVRPGDTVRLYVSRGSKIETKKMPNLVGKTEREARVEMERNNLVVGTVTYEFSSEPEGTVIRQSRVAFTSIAEGTTIDFVVSRGPEPVSPTPTP